MKKILFIIPLFLLVACGGVNGVVLDSETANELHFSVHYQSVTPDELDVTKRTLTYYKHLLKILTTVQSRGFKYIYVVKDAPKPPYGRELHDVLGQPNKEVVIPIVIGVSNDDQGSDLHYDNVEETVKGLTRAIQKLEADINK